MIVVFWSPKAGVSGATANMLLMAHSIADRGIGRCLILKPDYSESSPESLVYSNVVEDEVLFEDRGIDSLLMNMKSKPLSAELLRDCTTELIENRLDILHSTRNNRRYFSSESLSMLTSIPSLARQYYEVVFVDANAGFGSISEALMQMADIVVVNLRQSPEMIGQVISHNLLREKSFYLFGQFSSESRYSLNNLRRRYRGLNRRNSAMIPFDGAISDAICEGRLYEYLAAIENADSRSHEREVCASIQESSELLLQMMNEKMTGGSK